MLLSVAIKAASSRSGAQATIAGCEVAYHDGTHTTSIALTGPLLLTKLFCLQLVRPGQTCQHWQSLARCQCMAPQGTANNSLLVSSCLLQKELRLKDKERALAAERAALLEQQAAHQARDAALETMQLKYHLAAMKIRE